MRTIKNDSFNGTDYKELIKISINNVPNEGFTVDEMRKRIRILDSMDKQGDMEFEDADFEIVKQCVNEQRWIKLDKDILTFVDAINK